MLGVIPRALALLACAAQIFSLPNPLEETVESDMQAIFSHISPQQVQTSGEQPPERNISAQGWFDPRLHGGRMLDFTTPTLGEPLNVFISGLSDPYVLTEHGLHAYAKSIGYSGECLGMHYGHIHDADLGDGLARRPEEFLARQAYFPVGGTCWESVRGGHHFRAWSQHGSGAWFIGASLEKDSSKNHQIVPDGYNLGRDFLVAQATAGSHWNSIWWRADVEWREGLLTPGSKGVNHDIAQDGRVAILTVIRL
ncbi:hypothetical protein WOLCODRAFT_136532 [Wolfiporia cocos MD-104 SS10]|uniref:Secreted protein n=1 Tax=Wolfiporia cocos (strain MD-104) TaxID=742152 RepID=A0A2H3JC84_WOLCO|nr:hypothetical protein WOLCODRAFT_136532 [Wolfiporia cocos MD-104 SS10]